MYLLNARRWSLSSGSRRWQVRRTLAGAAGLASAAFAAFATAACGAQAADVSLPPKAAPATAATPAAGAAVAATPAQAVAAAYRGYWQAYAAAMTVGSAGQAAAVLAPYEAPAGMPQLIRTLKLVWAAGDAAYGGAITHVKSVQITGARAILNDCLDLSQFGAVNQATGQLVPDSFGQPNLDYYVTLLRSGGRWRVSNMQPVEVPCKP